MDLGIRGKVALVTGASAGIGEAVALALAREGVRLAVSARRRDRLEDVARRAPELVMRHFFGRRPADMIAVVEAAIGRKLPANFAATVTAAILWRLRRELRPMPHAAYALTLQSALQLIRAVLPGMRARGWGRIVALESIVVKQPLPGMVLSNAFRASVAAALKTLSSEVAAEGVTVNTIATGLVDTDRFRQVFDTPAKIAAAVAAVPIKRPATPAEYAPLVVFLCGVPAGYVTGQTLSVDGGLTAGIFG